VSPQLRPMTTADLDNVLKLEVALFGEESWSRQMLVGELGQQPASRYYLVAEEGGTIVGYAGLLAAGGQADVLTIAVSTARWGQGIGSLLLGELLTEAVRRGCTEIFLEVRADNVRAQRLYRWWGFDDIGIRRGYYQPSGMDAIVMRRDLAGVLRPGVAGEPAAGESAAGEPAAGEPAGGGSAGWPESAGGSATRGPGAST
jgi:[ribosomal protein S18]-alanine N-acetyltransferase